MGEIAGRLGGMREPEGDEGREVRELAPDAAGARWLRRHMAAGVAVVTTRCDGEYRGATITGFTFVSEDPCLVLISLEIESQMAGWLEQTGIFALNLLPWREQFLADRFAGFAPRASRTLADVAHHIAETGAPILSASLAWADCTIERRIEIGDHLCFIGRALALGPGSGDSEDPLLYAVNRYRRLR